MLFATTFSLVWLTFSPERPAKSVFERAMIVSLLQWSGRGGGAIGRRCGDCHHVGHWQCFATIQLEEHFVVLNAHGIHQPNDCVVVPIQALDEFPDEISGRPEL